MMTLELNAQSLIGTKAQLKKIQEGLRNARPFFSELEKQILQENDTQFSTEGAYLGEKWEKLSQATVIQRGKLGFGAGPILQRTGKLKRSTRKKQVTNTSLTISNTAPYYKYHQLGTRKMPKRTILTWGKNNTRSAEELFKKYLNKLING